MSGSRGSTLPFERRFTIPTSRREEVEQVERAILEAIRQRGYGRRGEFAIRLALQEALMNAFHHGNRDDPRKRVHVACFVDGEAAVMEIEDEGEGFDLAAVPDPTQPENVEIPSGRGIVLIRAYMHEVQYRPPGNRVRLVYRARNE